MVRKKNTWFDYLNVFSLFLFCVTIIFPFIHIFSVSLSSMDNVLRGTVSIFPKGFDIIAYKYIFSSNKIPLAYWNTILYTVVGTTINVLFTAVSGYPLSKKNLFARNFITKFIIITMVFSGGLIPNYLLVVYLGMYNTIWSLVIPGAISSMFLFMAISFFQTIPDELEESAKIDGASLFSILFNIILPLSKPILAALTLFYSMGHYNSYSAPLIYLTDKNKFPLQIVLQSMVIQNKSLVEGVGLKTFGDVPEQALRYATIFASIIPILCVYPFVQKQFVKGVMIGALKA